MKRVLLTRIVIVLCLLSLPAGLPTAQAQSGGSYTIRATTLDSGGGSSASQDGRYRVTGTIGQPDAGMQDGGTYHVDGGFWAGVRITVFAMSAAGLAALGVLLILFGRRRPLGSELRSTSA